jgi:poly(A) polymerase
VDAASEYALGYASARVGRYRYEISNHLEEELSLGRSDRSLLFLAALLHDVAKPHTRTVEESGRVRFFGHELQGRALAETRAVALRLSNDEVERVTRIIQHHMRPVLLAQKGAASVTPRAIYRFFRDTGPAGVDICLLTLADLLGTRGPELGQAEWADRVDTVVALLDAYYRTPEKIVHPPALVTGEDVLALGVPPSKRVGELLEAVREAQVEGLVTDQPGALELLKQLVAEKSV